MKLKIGGGLIIFCLIFQTCGAETAKEAELLFMAKKAYEDGFYEVSLGMLERLGKDFPDSAKSADARLLSSQCYFYQGRYLEALNILEALLNSPGSAGLKDAIYYWIAEVHFKGNNFVKAIIFYEKIIHDFPSSAYLPEAYYSLGWSFANSEKYDRALEVFQTLVEKFPKEPQSKDAIFKIIECLYNLKKYPELTNKIKPCFKLYANDALRLPYLHFYLAEAAYYLDNFPEAIESYLKAAQTSKDEKVQALAKLGLGWSYLKLKKYRLAQEAFSDILSANIDQKANDILLLGRALLMSQLNRAYEAKEIYERLISVSSDAVILAQAYLGLADALYNLADYDQAVTVYQTGLAKIVKDDTTRQLIWKLHYNLSLAYLKISQFQLAINELRKVLNDSTEEEVKASTLLRIGDIYQENNDFVQALETYQQIFEDYPRFSAGDYLSLQLGLTQFKNKNFILARGSLNSLIQNYPKSQYLDDANYYLGSVYFAEEDYSHGAEVFMKFQNEFKDSPLRAQGLYILGSCWLNLTKIEEALAVFKEILKLNPQDISLLQKVEYEIADCFYKLGQVDEALSRFKMIRARYPDSKLTAEVMWWLGQYYLEHEDLNLARRYFNSLVQDFSGSSLIADAYYALGLISQQENNFEEAVKNFNLAFKFGNAGLGNQALIALGDLNLEKENFQEALDTYQELLKNNPQLSKVLLGRIADTYYKLQDYKKAKSFYLQSLEVVDSKELANMRFKFAEVLEANSELNAAAKEYLEVAKLSRGDLKLLLRALLRAAKLYEDQDKYLEAAKIYAQVVDKGTEEGRFAKERLEWIMANVYKK